MEKMKLKYLGDNPTRVLTERNGSKVDVKTGDVVEVNKDVAVAILKSYKGVWVSADESVQLKKTEMKVEGDLDEDKIEKAANKKKK